MRQEPSTSTPKKRHGPSNSVSRKKRAVKLASRVTVSVSGKTSLDVSPDVALIKPPRKPRPHKVIWRFDDDVIPAGGRVAIDFETYGGVKGPFPEGSPNGLGRGRYGAPKSNRLQIDSGETDQARNPADSDYWKYKVEVFDAKSTRVRWVDPGVAIDEDPETGH